MCVVVMVTSYDNHPEDLGFPIPLANARNVQRMKQPIGRFSQGKVEHPNAQPVRRSKRVGVARAHNLLSKRVFYVLHWILYFLPGGKGESVPNMRRGEE